MSLPALRLTAALVATVSCNENTGPSFVPVHPGGAAVTTLPLGSGPWDAAISPQGLAYVGRPLTDSIARIDLSTPAVAANFLVGNRPDGISFNAAGTTAYVANINDHTIGVINTVTATQTTTYPVAGGPLRLALGPGETNLYVTMDNGVLAVLNVGTGALVTSITIGATPNGLALTPTRSQLYVSDATNGTVTEVNTASNAVGRTFAIGGTPQDLAVSRDGRALFIANETGWLGVWSLQTGLRTDSIAVLGAFGLGLTPDGAQLYVTQTNVGSVSVIDCTTLTVAKTIYTLGAPRHIAFTPDGSVALLANEAGFVQIIR